MQKLPGQPVPYVKMAMIINARQSIIRPGIAVHEEYSLSPCVGFRTWDGRQLSAVPVVPCAHAMMGRHLLAAVARGYDQSAIWRERRRGKLNAGNRSCKRLKVSADPADSRNSSFTLARANRSRYRWA